MTWRRMKAALGQELNITGGRKRGMTVWIVRLVERYCNRIIVNPVDNRNTMTFTVAIVHLGILILVTRVSHYKLLNSNELLMCVHHHHLVRHTLMLP